MINTYYFHNLINYYRNHWVLRSIGFKALNENHNQFEELSFTEILEGGRVWREIAANQFTRQLTIPSTWLIKYKQKS